MTTIPDTNPTSLVEVIRNAPLDRRYWLTFAVLSGVSAIDYFDFFIVGFLVADFAREWHLTYLQTAIILLAGGIGSIVGALLGGVLADRIGRKPILFWGCLIGGVAGGSMALVPDGHWLIFAALRLIVGMVVGSMGAAVIAIIVELTPDRNRSVITGLNIVAPSVGVLLASLTAGALLSTLGWRVVAALGVLPLLFLFPVRWWVPESVLWLIASGRTEKARVEAGLRAAGRRKPASRRQRYSVARSPNLSRCPHPRPDPLHAAASLKARDGFGSSS